MTPGRAIADLTRERPQMAVTFYAVLAFFALHAAVTHDGRVWAYLTVIVILFGVTATVDRTVQFSDHALWMLLVAATLHLSGGLLPGWHGHAVLYDAWIDTGVLRVDQVVHTWGSTAAAVAMWEVLGTYVDPVRMRPRTQALIAGLASLGKGAINEVLEFLTAINVPGTHVGGYTNTGWDLTFNLLGASSAGVLLVAAGAARRPAARLAPWRPRSLQPSTAR